ncbi:MAG: flagellar biosynthesis anti-sigma factor FlgM [Acidobacteriota bacterium]|jgi:negative regulator of flagellin synthesis FlgM|nr:flagellar biosynthesis anti-sigma factor FlgM [Acidobacteriota bacterium]
MEINGTNPLIVLNNGMQRLESPQKAEQSVKSGGAPSETDRLELSVRGREIAHLNELIQSVPDVREQKVEQVRRELENGTYNVKAEKIAEKIIGGNLLDEVF